MSIYSIILIKSAFACLLCLKSYLDFFFFVLSLQNGGVNSGHGFGSSGGVNSGGSKANELALELGWERIRNKVPTTVPELESHHPYSPYAIPEVSPSRIGQSTHRRGRVRERSVL